MKKFFSLNKYIIYRFTTEITPFKKVNLKFRGVLQGFIKKPHLKYRKENWNEKLFSAIKQM